MPLADPIDGAWTAVIDKESTNGLCADICRLRARSASCFGVGSIKTETLWIIPMIPQIINGIESAL